MLNLAQKYVEDHNISFSTGPNPNKSKTKDMIFSRAKLSFSPAPVTLNGDPLPWVSHAKYLGNKLSNLPDGLSKDIKCQRAEYIEKNNEIMQEFPSTHPEFLCNLNRVYNSSFPGSLLYDLSSNACKQLVNSWSVSVRQMWNLPFNAHRYLIEPLSGHHAETMLFSRYVNFVQNCILKSTKHAVILLFLKVSKNIN